MSLTRKTIKAGSWQFIALVVKAILQLLVLAILARLVTPEEFGYVAVINTILVFMEMFAEIGLGATIIQKSKINKLYINNTFTMSIIMGFLITVLVWLSAPLLAIFFHTSKLVSMIRISGLTLFITKFGIVSKSLLERNLDFKKIMWVNITSYFLGYAVIGIILAFSNLGAWSLVYARVSQCIFQTIGYYMLKPHSVNFILSKRVIKDILHFGGGLTISRLFNNIAERGDYLVVGRLLGPEVLGIYERSFNIMALPGTYFGRVLDKALFPSMAKVQLDKKRLKKSYLRALSIVNIALVPTLIIMILLAPEIIRVILGSDWMKAVIPLQILLITLSFRTSVRISDALARAVGAVYKGAKRKMFFAFAVFLGTYTGHFFGLIGICIAVNFAVLLNYILMVSLSFEIIKAKFSEYFIKSIHGYLIGLICLLINYPLTRILRQYIGYSIIIILVIGIVNVIILLMIILFYPKIIGEDGLWLINMLIDLSFMKKNKWLSSLRNKILIVLEDNYG